MEGTVYTADPITNLLVLNTSTSASGISPNVLTVPQGAYRIIPISQIASTQLLNLPSSTASANEPADSATNSSIDTVGLTARLNRTISSLQSAQMRQGPKGTTAADQALFDALSRTHPARWYGSSMVVSDTYLIEKPYTLVNVRLMDGAHGDLDRMRRVLDMEKNKLTLRAGKGLIDGRMGDSGTGKSVPMGGMKKGG